MNIQYEITEHSLIFTLDGEGRKELVELLERETQGTLEEDIFTLLDSFFWVLPEDIGALTSAPILADLDMLEDGTYHPETTFYWYPQYETVSPLETLRDTGRVVFTKAGKND